MADIISIPQIVWKILNITPQLLSQYRTVQDQLLWLIFIPSLVLIFFIYLFATTFTAGHKGFRNLFGIAAYLTIILSGWYGKFLIPVFLAWWWALIIISLFFFILNVFGLKPSKAKELIAMGGQAAVDRAIEMRQAKKQLRDIDNALKRYNIDSNKPLTSQRAFEDMDDKAKDTIVKLMHEREKLKRLAREWI